MLVLVRHVGEQIILNRHIKIKVLKIKNLNGNPQVFIGIDAPENVEIHREEVLDRILRKESANQAKWQDEVGSPASMRNE